jgi:hypothetical protein
MDLHCLWLLAVHITSSKPLARCPQHVSFKGNPGPTTSPFSRSYLLPTDVWVQLLVAVSYAALALRRNEASEGPRISNFHQQMRGSNTTEEEATDIYLGSKQIETKHKTTNFVTPLSQIVCLSGAGLHTLSLARCKTITTQTTK